MLSGAIQDTDICAALVSESVVVDFLDCILAYSRKGFIVLKVGGSGVSVAKLCRHGKVFGTIFLYRHLKWCWPVCFGLPKFRVDQQELHV